MTITVSKLGLHSIGPKHDGLLDFYKKINDAGRRLSLVKCRNDFGAAYEARQLWPDVLTIGASNQFDGDASFDYTAFKRIISLNPHIQYWEIFNEINGDWQIQADFYLKWMPQFKQDGINICVFNCASGTPQYPEIDPVPYQQIARVMKWAKQNDYDILLGLHEYGESPDEIERYHKLMDYLTAMDALVPIAITEAAPDPGSFVGITPFMDWCKQYDIDMLDDKDVLGCALFTLGGAGWQGMNYETALPQLGDYIALLEIPTPPPPPPPPEPEMVALTERMTALEDRMLANETLDMLQSGVVTGLDARITKLENAAPPLTGRVEILSAIFTPTTLQSGQLLNVGIKVFNGTPYTLTTMLPNSGYVYDEGTDFRTAGFNEVNAVYRVGVDFAGRGGVDHPYRWGLDKPLLSGEARMVTGAIRLNTARTTDYWTGIVQEQVSWAQDGVGRATITVTAPPPPPPVNAMGIDVSHYQGTIDWSKVKASGKAFAFVKATESNNYTDNTFAINWAGAKSAGLLRGAYHFYRFGVDPVAQANLFLSALGNDLGELPPVVDVEDTNIATPNINEIKTFLDVVQTRTNRRCIIYTGNWYWNNARWGGSVSWAKDYALWCASYTATPVIPSDWATVSWKFWQYSSTGTVDGITGNVDLDQYSSTLESLRQYVSSQPVPPPQPSRVYFGLGHGTQAEIPQSHIDLYGTAFASDPYPAFKFLTLPDAGMMTRSIQRVISKTPKALLLCRLFFSTDFTNKTRFTPQQFMDYCANGTAAAYSAGVKFFEIGNEPNIAEEGYGWNWANGLEYGNWLKQVVSLLRGKYPQAQLFMGGLSPQPNVPNFLNELSQSGVISMLDGACGHGYWWTENSGTWNMIDQSGGLSWLPIKQAFGSKPFIVSEFSNNNPSVSLSIKGGQYKRYRDILVNNGVIAATSFVLNWSPDDNHESWCSANGSDTGITSGYISA